MKKTLTILFLIQISLSVQAQKVPYEKLDSISAAISKLQFEANGLKYNDGKTDYEISFPDENFAVAFNSQLATNVVYKKSSNKELMYLTENISLGRVVGFTSEVMENNIVAWKINFGKFTVTTQIFEDGKLIDTTFKNEMILYSYINANKKATDPTFFNSFSELCNTMKRGIDMITDKELESENKDWSDKNIARADFVKKHPNSVRTMQAKNIIANKEKAKAEIAQKFVPIMEYASKYQFLWKPNMTEQEFKTYNGTIYQYKWMLYGNSTHTRDVGMPLSVIGYSPDGPNTYRINNLGKVSYFHVIYKRVKKEKEATRKFYEDAKKSVSNAENYFTVDGDSFTIAIPKSQNEPKEIEYYITTLITEIDKWSLINIIFHTDKSLK
ncbi:hypothetical protein [Flavobacterium sp.]|uniref:hypothetical protein n=1 Tax=Flavobacterium sp. TaxID=239 RepID=UPI00286C4615|nr:hypothetical protein [Flavobacterium sp.]